MTKIWKQYVTPSLRIIFPSSGFGWIIFEAFIVVSVCSVFVRNLTVNTLWTDELLTFYQVHHLGFLGFWDSMGVGVNVMPFTSFIPYLILDQWIGLNAFTLRLPSLVSCVGVIFLFLFLFRKQSREGWVHLLLVVFLAWNPSFTYYTSEARPYQLLLLSTLASVWIGYSSLNRRKPAWTQFLAGALMMMIPFSVHYIGLFYGAIILLTVGVVGYFCSSKKEAFILCVGGILGAVLSIQLFGKHMLVAVKKEGLINPNYLDTPTLGELFRLGIFHPTIPGIWILWCLLGIVFSLGSFALVRRKRSGSDQSRNVTGFNFLLVSGFGFLLLPNFLCVLAVMGFPNLCLERYFYPGILAIPMILIGLVGLIKDRFELDCDTLEFWSDWTKLGCVFFVGLLSVTTVSHLRKQPNTNGIEWNAEFEEFGKTPVIVTPHMHVFFEWSNKYADHAQVYWLRKSQREVEMVSIFNPELRSVDPEGMGDFSHFIFLDSEPASINSFPDFDLQCWAMENESNITQISENSWSVERQERTITE